MSLSTGRSVFTHDGARFYMSSLKEKNRHCALVVQDSTMIGHLFFISSPKKKKKIERWSFKIQPWWCTFSASRLCQRLMCGSWRTNRSRFNHRACHLHLISVRKKNNYRAGVVQGIPWRVRTHGHCRGGFGLMLGRSINCD